MIGAGASLPELSAKSGVDVVRLRGFELNRTRLTERETLRLYHLLFQLLTARLGDMENSDRALEVIEQMPMLDVEALLPIPLPPF